MSESTTLSAAGLSVTFFEFRDRIAHTIRLEQAAGHLPLLASAEGSADEDWPASPPLQSIHGDRPASGRVRAMLLGMAGRGHWSLAAEQDPATGRLVFDVACRLSEPPQGFLGSSYRAMVAAEVEAGSGLVLPSAGTGCRLIPLEGCRIAATPDGLALAAETPVRVPATVRWRYAVESLGASAP